MENRDTFLAAGGESYAYIPCLNDRRSHIAMLSELVMKHVQGWLPTQTPSERDKELEQRKARAVATGAAD